MNLKQLIVFGIENSSEPVIKNPILRAALEEPESMVGTPTKEVTQYGRRIYNTPEGNVSEKSTTFFLNGKWLNVPSIHGGRSFNDDQLRFMIKEGKIEPTSVHGSRIEAEEAAGLRSDMMKSHEKGFEDGGRIGLFMGGSEASQKGAIASAKKRKINITEVSDELIKKVKNTKLKGTGVAIETTSGGGKVIRVRMNPAYPELDVFKIDSLPATEENLKKIQNHLNNIKNTKTYKKIVPWKGSAEKRAIRKGKELDIKTGDPEHIYKKTQKKKTKIFPGEKSKTEQIHHGKKKSLPQTTEKWFLIDENLNNLDSLKDAETARDGLYAERNIIKKNKKFSISEKTRKLEEINAKLKRIIKNKKFKSTEGKGLVDITLESMDEAGKIISKDMGADISKSLGWNTKTGKLDLTKLKSGEGKKVLAELEEKLLTHLKGNPKLALEIQKQLDEGVDITKILNSPAVKKRMPTWIKGELYFVAADIINNWTKGQSFWKGLGKGIETGSFGIIDLNTDERALLSKGKKLVDQGVITQQEFDAMESWLKYTAALKKRRSNQNYLFSAAQDLKENEEQSSRKNILEGEIAGWNTLEANVPDLEADVRKGAENVDKSTEELDQSIDSYYSITDDDTMGYNTMSKVMDHLVGEEWNKPAGTIIDRGKRRNQGEGMIWGPIGGAITDVGNLAASPWLGLKDSNTLEQMKMNFQKNKPQERIMQHPVHGFEEAKLKYPEAWEDIALDMDYALNPTEQLYKGGGIASLKKKW